MSKKNSKSNKKKKTKSGGGSHNLSRSALLDKLGALEFRHEQLISRYNLATGKLDDLRVTNGRLAIALQRSETDLVAARVARAICRDEKSALDGKYTVAIDDADALAYELAIAHDLLDAERLIGQQQRAIIEIETGRVNRQAITA